MPRTKIICTLGPSSQEARVLLKMIRAGMAVARINCSHGSRPQHLSGIESVREINRRHGTTVGILLDLQGYRIRVGRFGRGRAGAVQLRAGQLVELGSSGECGPSLIPLDYEGALTRVRVGSRVYIDDGNVALEVTGMAQGRLRARVVTPGVVKEKKGVNIPDLILAEKGLTAKDRDDFGFGLDNGVRLFAQSFVRSRNDMALLREFAAEKGSSCKLVAKIENRRAVRALDDIMALSDGIMVARGDLGVSLPFYEVPMLQKKILRECRRRRRFGITATQMLESMTEHPTPTRAEVSDVANAVLDGSDFVMLSGETAVGRHPVEAVSAMREIIRFTEKYAGGSAKQRPRARVSGPTPGGIG